VYSGQLVILIINYSIALCQREEDIEDIKEPTDNVTEINIEDNW